MSTYVPLSLRDKKIDDQRDLRGRQAQRGIPRPLSAEGPGFPASVTNQKSHAQTGSERTSWYRLSKPVRSGG